MQWQELGLEQRRIFVDTVQLYEAFQRVVVELQQYRGGLTWKTVSGKDYLVKITTRAGGTKSLGPRSEETERIYASFQARKKDLKDSEASLRGKLVQQARFCKAAWLTRVPKIVADILRAMYQRGLHEHNALVVGTNALYAYEAAAGCQIHGDMLATKDLDVLWDTRSRLKIVVSDQTRDAGFLGVLRDVDKTFEPITKDGFRAVNKDGYLVDLIKPMPNPPFKQEKVKMHPDDQMTASEIYGLQWLVSSPKLTQAVIGEDGLPAIMAVPDPRAFALHKLWLSKQPDRDRIKVVRDREQANLVAEMVHEFFPQTAFTDDELRFFPKPVRDEGHKIW